MAEHDQINQHSKDQDLAGARVDPGERLTSNQGTRIGDNQNTLRAGPRGPSLLEDHFFREKITHFDHERIPERVVHARGSAAHGFFQVYEPLAEYTSAAFLNDPSVQTPVFVRFSTVAGSRGSADTVRDVRGFAVKFYTSQGNFDLVGNNIPVFFIQDAIKFPDLVHAVKPEPDWEIPQASTAHDTFWDFISVFPESMHMVMWIMSDRAIPRSYRTMEGFGVHTFRLVNAAGRARFVKFHWKPLLGVHSLVWDEAQKIAGKDPDFHRRDLWDAIASGNYPEYELGLQIIEEDDEFAFDFDILDATKIWPENLVPVRRVGKLTLNRNPDNFFSETEQVAFHPGHLVPGIDFSNDPLLQGRLFSYLDTQLSRLGSPNFAELPINRPVAPVRNNQRDGHMRYTMNRGKVAYEPNGLAGGCPMQSPAELGGYVSHPAPVEGPKVRERSASFADHVGQARMFWHSMSAVEQAHIVEAFQFELSKVVHKEVRQRMLGLLAQVDGGLAAQVAPAVGVAVPEGHAAEGQPRRADGLSMADTPKASAQGRKVAVLAAEGSDTDQILALRQALAQAGVQAELVSLRLGTLGGPRGQTLEVDKTLWNSASVLYDALLIPGGAAGVAALLASGEARHFVNEAYKHYKPIGALDEGLELLAASAIQGVGVAGPRAQGALVSEHGVVTARQLLEHDRFAEAFIAALKQHRHWQRPKTELVPA